MHMPILPKGISTVTRVHQYSSDTGTPVFPCHCSHPAPRTLLSHPGPRPPASSANSREGKQCPHLLSLEALFHPGTSLKLVLLKSESQTLSTSFSCFSPQAASSVTVLVLYFLFRLSLFYTSVFPLRFKQKEETLSFRGKKKKKEKSTSLCDEAGRGKENKRERKRANKKPKNQVTPT